MGSGTAKMGKIGRGGLRIPPLRHGSVADQSSTPDGGEFLGGNARLPFSKVRMSLGLEESGIHRRQCVTRLLQFSLSGQADEFAKVPRRRVDGADAHAICQIVCLQSKQLNT